MTFNPSRIRKQTINFKQINKFLEKAYKTAKTAGEALKDDPDSAFSLAYDSMLKTTLSLMLSHGYRPRTQLGHHQTLVDYAKYVLGERFANITSTYGQIKKKRHKILYDILSVTKSDAEQAVKTAKKYFEIVEQKISSQNPQQKLWKP